MGVDKKFYCDFKECQIGEQNFKTGVKDIVHNFVLDKEEFIVIGIFCNDKALVREYTLDMANFTNSWARSETAYFNEIGLIRAFKHKLSAGTHTIQVKCEVNENAPSDWTADVRLYLYKLSVTKEGNASVLPDKIIKYPAPQKFKHSVMKKDFSSYNKGAGEGFRAIGRFGFTKGDGILDCAMTTLGGINRMYLFGHPDYKKTTRWQYSVLPRGINPETCFHGSFPPAQVGIEDDKIDLSYISVKWGTVFKRDDRNINFSCRYSLASAGVMVETDDDRLTLSELEYAGNYTRIMLPLEKGLTIRNISLSDIAYDRNTDGKLKENWVLFLGTDAFPDIPLQAVMQKHPDKIILNHSNGVLNGADIITTETFGIGFMVSPFGIETFKAGKTLSVDFEKDAYSRCHFWSKAVLEYPVDAEEFYKLDKKNEMVEIVQKFKYQTVKDEWNTEPLKIAPLPPPLSILDDTDIVDYIQDIADFKFPTKYGWLKGCVGCEFSSYTIPFMPRERIFPLRNTNSNKISELLEEDLAAYFEFHEKFEPTMQASPFSGACTESYAWTSSLGNYMNEANRAKFASKTSERLVLACNPDGEYAYPIVNHRDFMKEPPGTIQVLEIYSDPNLPKIKLHNWYWRKELLTGLKYRICYLNVCMFYNGDIKEGTRKEIFNLKKPLIENDWGLGVAFYAMYLSALTSGNFSPIRKNWQVLSEAFKYFETFHDWACMGSAYCENGKTWVEGAGYGAFTSFVNMAEAVDDKDAYSRSVYMSSKYLALRLAIFKSSYSYFYRFFNRKAWYITKHFHDEVDPQGAFQNVPDLWDEKYRYEGIFNLTTEGFFLETFQMLQKFLPKDLNSLHDIAMDCYKDENRKGGQWILEQENCSCLLAAVVNENFDKARLLREIDEVNKRGFLIKNWRAMHSFSRLLPENYFRCLLLSLLENREHPVWMEFWRNIEIRNAEYDPEKKKALISFKILSEKGMIRLGIREKASAVLFNDKKIKYNIIGKAKIEIELSSSGNLELIFS